ncbi:hypothetical protein [Ornithinibacillus sp. FSL M8-0202]|uniref:hypothetical protein n=1 Tax=unclassified Ornithinibacillus TaxID=2620869 RepID=UPI0030D35308
MKCGAKRYVVEAELNGTKWLKTVIARSPAEARKKFRFSYGSDVSIIAVKQVKGQLEYV